MPPKMLTLQPVNFLAFIRIILIVFPLCLNLFLIKKTYFVVVCFGKMVRECKCSKLNVICSYSSVSRKHGFSLLCSRLLNF